MSEEEYRKVFVKKLGYYMQLNGKNQMDLMKDLNLKSATVSSWCTGKKLPRMDKIQMLADYFHIEKSDLLEDKNDDFELSYKQIIDKLRDNSQYKELFDYIIQLPDSDLYFLIEMAKKLKKGDWLWEFLTFLKKLL